METKDTKKKTVTNQLSQGKPDAAPETDPAAAGAATDEDVTGAGYRRRSGSLTGYIEHPHKVRGNAEVDRFEPAVAEQSPSLHW
jgi:hypothetical protein